MNKDNSKKTLMEKIRQMRLRSLHKKLQTNPELKKKIFQKKPNPPLKSKLPLEEKHIKIEEVRRIKLNKLINIFKQQKKNLKE